MERINLLILICLYYFLLIYSKIFHDFFFVDKDLTLEQNHTQHVFSFNFRILLATCFTSDFSTWSMRTTGHYISQYFCNHILSWRWSIAFLWNNYTDYNVLEILPFSKMESNVRFVYWNDCFCFCHFHMCS